MPKYYPFLNSERDRLKSLDLKIIDISENPIYSAALSSATSDVIGGGKEPQDRDLAIIEFTMAKILLSIAGDDEISEAYSERKSGEFRDDLEKENLTFLIKIAVEDFGMNMKTEESLRVSFIDFLRYKPDFLKLSQMNLYRGYVQVTKNQLTWILKGAIKKRILDTIPKSGKFPESFEQAAGTIKGKFKKTERKVQMPKIKNLNEAALPPCIRDIIKAIESNKANHNAHFVLVTFLHGLNLDEAAILDIFRRSPKFKERTAAYQIRFAKEREYTCPACDSIKGYGLCTGDCEKNHPISNYFLNLRQNKAKAYSKEVERIDRSQGEKTGREEEKEALEVKKDG